MAAISIGIIGKNNEPLYMREFGDDVGTAENTSEEALFGLPVAGFEKDSESQVTTSAEFDCSIRQQFILHAALDRFQQLAGLPPGMGWRKPGVSGTDGMFVGLLCPFEEMRVYGYVTTTKIMIILVVEDDAVPELQQNVDSDIKSLLVKVHQLFIEDTFNPFKEIGSPIVSKRFDERVRKYVAVFNQSDGMI